VRRVGVGAVGELVGVEVGVRGVLQARQRVVRDLGRHLRPGVGEAVGDDELARAPAACRRATARGRGRGSAAAMASVQIRQGESGEDRHRGGIGGGAAILAPCATCTRGGSAMRECLRHNGLHGDPPPRHASARARAQRPGRALGISLIQITLALTAGKLAALAAATGAICASLADLPIAPARTWRRVGMGALVGWASGLLVSLLRESGVAMGFTIILLSFCSTMALAWGLRAGPLSFIPILALIFTLAAPPPASTRRC
jgi:hypothetical protein